MRAFESFRTGYNEWLRRFKESFGSDKTKAEPRKRDEPSGPGAGWKKTANVLALAALVAAGAYAYSQTKQ
jgi:hypothetical protein